uniref:Family S53 protease n=1 Tax=Mycena chlorophos TaxID=658473 RepID=A0ABQ0MC48_MYCCL|nr:family S53 protease [Mycena chlorophos]
MASDCLNSPRYSLSDTLKQRNWLRSSLAANGASTQRWPTSPKLLFCVAAKRSPSFARSVVVENAVSRYQCQALGARGRDMEGFVAETAYVFFHALLTVISSLWLPTRSLPSPRLESVAIRHMLHQATMSGDAMSVSTLFLASLASLAAAGPAIQNFVVQDSLSAAPSTFTKTGVTPDSQLLTLRIALPSNDFAGLEAALFDVSTPSSANYGEHLSKEQVNAFVAPSTEATSAVQAWLASYDLTATAVSSAGDWLSLTVPVSTANEMLAAKYENFVHASGKTIARTLSFSLPADVAPFIQAIHPTTTFNNPESRGPTLSDVKAEDKTPSVTVDATSSCSRTITPACVQSLYSIPTTPATESDNIIAVAGFIGQYAQSADLKTFLKDYRTDISDTTTFTLKTLDGGSNPQKASDAGLEANLDVQMTVGLATDVPVWFVSVGTDYQDGDLEGFLDIVNYLSDQDTIPQVMTTSYGENETDMTKKLAFKLCEAYAAMGARGTSILFASGDGGVEGGQDQSCKTYQAAFPAGCPYLTAVGATQGVPETAADFSSGGFSNYWGAPSYQTDAVEAFLTAQGKTNKGLFNASGRGYPDVSAAGVSVEIVSGGEKQPVDGTSCASPIFASVIGLINDKLIAAGNSPLGFLNPWLYSNPDMLNDITSGSNPGCGAAGFTARSGWDPISGLGSPSYKKMLTAAGL